MLRKLQLICKLLKTSKFLSLCLINATLCNKVVQGAKQWAKSALVAQIGINILKTIPLANHYITEGKDRGRLQRILLVAIEQ